MKKHSFCEGNLWIEVKYKQGQNLGQLPAIHVLTGRRDGGRKHQHYIIDDTGIAFGKGPNSVSPDGLVDEIRTVKVQDGERREHSWKRKVTSGQVGQAACV